MIRFIKFTYKKIHELNITKKNKKTLKKLAKDIKVFPKKKKKKSKIWLWTVQILTKDEKQELVEYTNKYQEMRKHLIVIIRNYYFKK